MRISFGQRFFWSSDPSRLDYSCASPPFQSQHGGFFLFHNFRNSVWKQHWENLPRPGNPAELPDVRLLVQIVLADAEGSGLVL